jgi:hypothetical protein
VTVQTQTLRDAGWTAAAMRDARREATRTAESREFYAAILSGRAAGWFCTARQRSYLRRMSGTSPLDRLVCHECDASADDCQCTSRGPYGRLAPYRCTVCGEISYSGEDCCEPEDEEDDEGGHRPPPVSDGYSRGPWTPIYRRDVTMHGEPEAWAPYYVGVELETDSTPSGDEWRALEASDLLLGAWYDGTVRGPEIVSQPVRGEALSNVVRLFSSLRVSLTSAHAPSEQQCGMHIHVDARHMTVRGKKAFIRLWLTVQDALWEHPDMHLRERGGYAIRLSTGEAQQAIDRISGEDYEYPIRYRDLNCSSLGEHGTFEIRLFGWPANANSWSQADRRDYMLRCIRWAQALRTAAKMIGESALGSAHPVYALDPHTALAFTESLVPLHSSYGEAV